MVALTEPLTPGALRPLTPTTSGFIVEEGLVVLVRRGMDTVLEPHPQTTKAKMTGATHSGL
jgi:hypothetical protein